MDRGPWWATVQRVAKNWTWLSDCVLTHMQSMVLSTGQVEELVQSRALFSWTYFPSETSTQINTISSNADDHSNEINSMVEWGAYFRQHGWRSHLREVTFWMRCRSKSWSYLQKRSTGTEKKWEIPRWIQASTGRSKEWGDELEMSMGSRAVRVELTWLWSRLIDFGLSVTASQQGKGKAMSKVQKKLEDRN